MASSSKLTPTLTTTYRPPAVCTEGHLTEMQYRQYEIWLNYPVPAPSVTITSCYPSEFLSSWEAASTITVEPFSMLVCPQNYATVYEQDFGDNKTYIACCPSGYDLAYPTTTMFSRPAQGATCYSAISEVEVTNSNAQAYALVMDGFIPAATTSSVVSTAKSSVGSTTASWTASSTTSSVISSSSGHVESGSSLSTGAKAGVGVGVGLGALLVS
ncbi:hypothetical protein V1511DRAFT_535220 [Dipodascopsis uninucleata]